MIYKITLNNYHGDTFFELYHDKANAQARMYEFAQEGKRKCDFESDEGNDLTWFDANYNEYDTYINLHECELESLFCD